MRGDLVMRVECPGKKGNKKGFLQAGDGRATVRKMKAGVGAR